MLPAVIFFYCAVMRRKVLHMLLAGENTLPFGGVYFLAVECMADFAGNYERLFVTEKGVFALVR